MTYIVQKQNIGSARTFATPANLARAIKRAGALKVEFSPKGDEVAVTWAGDVVVRYGIAKNGTVEYQLAWDMEV